MFTNLIARITSVGKSIRQWIDGKPVPTLAWITFGVVALLNSAKIGVLVWGICKLAAFSHAGNWVDCRFFPDDQPGNLDGIEQGTAWKRKAWLICSAILAGALLP